MKRKLLVPSLKLDKIINLFANFKKPILLEKQKKIIIFEIQDYTQKKFIESILCENMKYTLISNKNKPLFMYFSFFIDENLTIKYKIEIMQNNAIGIIFDIKGEIKDFLDCIYDNNLKNQFKLLYQNHILNLQINLLKKEFECELNNQNKKIDDLKKELLLLDENEIDFLDINKSFIFRNTYLKKQIIFSLSYYKELYDPFVNMIDDGGIYKEENIKSKKLINLISKLDELRKDFDVYHSIN